MKSDWIFIGKRLNCYFPPGFIFKITKYLLNYYRLNKTVILVLNNNISIIHFKGFLVVHCSYNTYNILFNKVWVASFFVLLSS